MPCHLAISRSNQTVREWFLSGFQLFLVLLLQ